MKKFLVILFVLFAFSFINNSEALTVTRSGNVVILTTLDADWVWTTTFASDTSGIRVHSIQFNPSAVGDICIIKEATDTGPQIFKVKCADTYDQRVKYFDGARLKPVFDLSDSTIGVAANASIIIILTDR